MTVVMEETKRDGTNKVKRSKNDNVKQVLSSYLHRRNTYNVISSSVTTKDLVVSKLVDGELSNPNSILYSCYNNDLVTIDHYFTKFVSWLKEVIKNNPLHRDLETLLGPFFCHLYLEILRGGQTEKAANFFKVHLVSIDKTKCDDMIQELINALTTDSNDLVALKKNFRLNKYKIKLLPKSVEILKKFITENSHVIFLQILQSWFVIEENFNDETDTDEDVVMEETMCNGFIDDGAKKLKEVIGALQKEIKPMFIVNLSNIKDDVSCGLIDRDIGLITYSYNNALFLKPLNTLRQFDNTDGFKEVVLREHCGRIYDISLCKSFKYIITASHDNTLIFFDLNDFVSKGTFRGHDYPVYCNDVSSNGLYLVSGSSDYTARLWSVEQFTTLRLYGGHTQEITSIDFHANSLYFATSSVDRSVRMWSITDATPCRLFYGSKGAVYSLAFSPGGKYLASAGEDKKLRVWDIASGKQFVEMKTGAEPILHIGWSKDEKVISAGTVDGTIRNWDFGNIEKNPTDTNTHDPVSYIPLNSKLLSMEHTKDTFACLTVNAGISTFA